MIFRLAKRLHNGDEVKVKKTDTYCMVLNAYISNEDPKTVIVETDYNGFTQFIHKEIA